MVYPRGLNVEKPAFAVQTSLIGRGNLKRRRHLAGCAALCIRRGILTPSVIQGVSSPGDSSKKGTGRPTSLRIAPNLSSFCPDWLLGCGLVLYIEAACLSHIMKAVGKAAEQLSLGSNALRLWA